MTTGGAPTRERTAPSERTRTMTRWLHTDVSADLDAAKRRLTRIVEVLRGTPVAVENYRPAEHGPLVSFDAPEGHEEVERYWLDAPFSFAAITRDPAANEHTYRVVEPALDAFERELLDSLFADVRNSFIYRRNLDGADAEASLVDELGELLEEYGAAVDMNAFYRLFYYLHRAFDGYGKLEPLMHDPRIEDVSCDGYDLPLFVYHDEYADVETDVSFGRDELDAFVIRLAQRSGRHVSIGEPVAEATLPDGSRAEMALGEEVTPRGSAFTIRKYAEEPMTPIDLIEYGTFSVEQMAYLWLCIENNKSLVFAGGTASGKTTSMNAVSMFIPPRSKVLSIEDTRELALHHDNWLSSVTRERADDGIDVSMYDLLRSALRHRPEYIIVGEVRGEEAITLFQAMNTGHTTFSTMHADSVQTVINRLENEPINVPRAMVQSLDILSVQTLVHVGDERVRRTDTVAEIKGIDQRTGDLDYSTAYSWDSAADGFSRNDSALLDDIRAQRGWSRKRLLGELRSRERVLEHLRAGGVSDYRRFTAAINDYYADPDAALDRIEDGVRAEPGAER